MGLKPNGTYGIRISSPGTDVDNPASPAIFDSDSLYAQKLFSAYVGIGQSVSYQFQQVGGIIGFGYYLAQYSFSGTYMFPYALPFLPVAMVYYDYHDQQIAAPRALFTGRGFHQTSVMDVVYTPSTDRVVFSGSFAQIGPIQQDPAPPNDFQMYGAYVSVLNIPIG
ncbi:hypothetical protein [Aurantimonas endophytica]|uniref:Uncharacterized protein n=1 Tax=Aurantimonas endophytica TaxID=1522175 RepID=A0A7W6H9L1_9HYPH|nr:hypothetical protein [Aurantimonas endophytica]MBB4000976.1 hypothetical protein [Aurantimonas endophytica]MCO6403365.1 hypothetical protein [Aurantimonas endophytica]